MEKSLDTPVLLLTFRRPDTTKLVFEEIRKARPKKLFLFSDGPRNNGDRKKIEGVRKIVSDVDWPCKVKKRFNKKNLGIIGGALGAINWFFENVEEGIILEDDGLPNQNFFRFCQELLERYRNDERIMHITGCNFQRGWVRGKYSYYFSKYPSGYGFATWRRARKKYDGNMSSYLEFKKGDFFSDIFPSKLEKSYAKYVMNHVYYNDPNAVDSRWKFSIFINNGLCIVPNKNLIKGIGFGEDSTHTKPIDSYFSRALEKMTFPLKHSPFIIRDRKSDERYIKWLISNKIKKHFLLKTGLYKLFKE